MGRNEKQKTKSGGEKKRCEEAWGPFFTWYAVFPHSGVPWKESLEGGYLLQEKLPLLRGTTLNRAYDERQEKTKATKQNKKMCSRLVGDHPRPPVWGKFNWTETKARIIWKKKMMIRVEKKKKMKGGTKKHICSVSEKKKWRKTKKLKHKD